MEYIDEDEDFCEGQFMSSSFSRVSVKSSVKHEYLIRLGRFITNPDDFHEEFQVLQQATANDTVKIDIMSNGGSFATCLMLVRAIKECDAPVYAHIGVNCASAASAIALACDGWEIDEMSSMMVHTGSFGAGYDKTRNVVANTVHSQKMIERFVKLTYADFMSEEEIGEVLEGKDVYFDSEQLEERFGKLVALRKAALEEEISEATERLENLVQESEKAA